MAGPDCRRAECKDNRVGKWKAKGAGAARNRRTRSRGKETGSCPSKETQESKQGRWRKSNNQRNRKRFVRQTRLRLPTNRARPTDRRNRRRDPPSRRAKYRRGQFSPTAQEAIAPLPKEIARSAKAAASPI